MGHDSGGGVEIFNDNTDFSFTNFTAMGNGSSGGFVIRHNNTNFTFTDGFASGDDSRGGFEVGNGNSNFSFTNIVADGADGVFLQDGSNFSLDNSTFDGLFNGDVLDVTNVTNLSGDGNTAQNFGGVLFNDGGGNTGVITFPFVDSDGDGVNEGPVIIP